MVANTTRLDAPSGTGKYVYGIIASREPRAFGPLGIGGNAPVFTVHFQDLAAVVSDTPLVGYEPTRANLLAHERVTGAVLAEHTILPLAFGTIFRSEGDIVEVMRSAYEALHNVLGQIEGRVEYGLQVSWEPDRILAEIEQGDARIRQRQREMEAGGREPTYFEQTELGQMVGAAVRQRREAYAAAILGALNGQAVASRTNDPIGDRMVLNAAFLVERRTEDEFARQVESVAAREPGLAFRLSGPWPPYNFVQVRLNIQPGGEE